MLGRRKKVYFFISIFTLLLGNFALAQVQPALKITDASATYETVERYLRVWEQGDQPFSTAPEAVLSGAFEDKFQPLPNGSNSFPAKKSYWAKLIIDYQADRDAEWLLKTGQNNYTDVYIQNESGQFIKKKAGFFHSIKEKDIPEGRDGELSLYLHSGDRKTIYIHAWDEANYPVKFAISLAPIKTWYNYVKALNLGQGLLLGALLIMLAYNLLVFILSGDKTYLFYSGYIFFGALYYANRAGFTREYLFPENVIVWQSLWVYAIALQPPFYLLFMRSFLKTSERIPKFDKVIKVVIGLMFLGTAVQMSIFYFAFNLSLVIYVTIAQFLFSCIFLLVCLIVIATIKDKLYRYFLIGSSAFFLGAFIGVGILAFNSARGAEFMPYVQAGFLSEIVLFSIGLGYRIRRNEQDKRKAQEELITQLKANEELQQRANEELERKVKERTFELALQKEEIEAQRDSIEQAYEEIQAKTETIEKKNQDITASINYAKRIQTAILPSENKVQESFEDAFIMFYPRDIVSGDFYWHADLGTHQVIAAVDCTGHGVPGAIMSMIGNDLLSEAVHLKDLRDPAAILEYADEHLKDRLQQESDTSIPDGMDMALCVIDEGRQEVLFAGAKNSLFWVESGEIKEFKGNRRPIGGQEKKKKHVPFTTQLLPYEETGHATFYLCSDGYQDQFGGPKGRKFMKRRLKELLQEISHLPMAEQKQRLEQSFQQWKGAERQIDDVLFIGVAI